MDEWYQMAREILKELGYWFLFRIVIALAQLWLVPFGYYLMHRPWTWVDLVGNGSLLFFATTTASKATGEYFKRVQRRRRSFHSFLHRSYVCDCVPVSFCLRTSNLHKGGVRGSKFLITGKNRHVIKYTCSLRNNFQRRDYAIYPSQRK